ncbi:enoyl-CoA hydratase/isomerase family protein [Marinactinospora rubrisoli]|uniref:Enoyl-CoA hydratase/isomerase family protein n=1 Tax=Marinactinospora rubrisoli TaxID=2715399 RepID=A0ABW2KBW0_9ACTN
MDAPDLAVHEEVGRLIHDLREERESRAAILTGSGQAFFTGLQDPVGSLLWQREQGLRVIDAGRQVAKRIVWDLLDVEIPIVAALNGDATGLGATIALFCDAIFMADTATIADPHVRIGVVAGDGGAAIWPMAMGPALAKRSLLTGDPVTASQAAHLGSSRTCAPSARCRLRRPRSPSVWPQAPPWPCATPRWPSTGCSKTPWQGPSSKASPMSC